MTFTILLSSAGRRVSLLRSLREAVAAIGLRGRVVACDLGWRAPAMHVADAGFVVPRCTDPAFAGEMIELCEREHVDVVVPTIDPELPVWAALRSTLATTGTAVAVSSAATVAIAADKSRTNAHCVAVGVPCPRQGRLADVRADPAGWTFPLIAKPRNGSASAGVRLIRTWADLGLIADSLAVPDGVIVEERAAGDEFTVDLYVDRDGTVRCPVVRRRLEVRGGEVSKARVVREPRLAAIAAKLVETLPGAYGPLNVQVFSDGRDISVIEVNARFGGGYPLTWRAGGRHGEWLIREAAGRGPLPVATPVEHGLTMLRWDEEVFVRGDPAEAGGGLRRR
jgi:carbamoyl-phosphate synthase large subunit